MPGTVKKLSARAFQRNFAESVRFLSARRGDPLVGPEGAFAIRGRPPRKQLGEPTGLSSADLDYTGPRTCLDFRGAGNAGW